MAMKLDLHTQPRRYAEEYSKTVISGTTYLQYRAVKELVLKYVKGKNTLDYGCGAGKSAIFLKSLGLSVTGVDVNEDMIKYASKADVNGRYKLITSANVSEDDNTFDLVFSSWVMVQVPSKSELNKIGKEISRILKPQGIFMMIVGSKDTYNNDWLSINTVFKENEKLYSGSRIKTQFKDVNNLIIDGFFWTEEDYREMLESNNMKVLEIHSPLGKDSDGYNWKLEKHLSPVHIYVAQKY